MRQEQIRNGIITRGQFTFYIPATLIAAAIRPPLCSRFSFADIDHAEKEQEIEIKATNT